MATFTLTPKGYRAALPVGLPDLVVQSVSASVGSPVVGDHVVFSAVVKNQGTAATPTGVGIGILFSVDANPVNWTTDTTGPLAAGATRTLTATSGPSGGNYWAATLGSHALSANVNDTLTISESNTGNNTLSTTLTVASAPSTAAAWGPVGNQGTRWVRDTPTFNQAVPNSVECDCTWAAIKTAISSFTAAQVAAGARVMVRPGSLPGNGNNSTSTPVIQSVGSTSWTQRVLVRPRDGYGTVTMGNIRIFRAHNITWAGFKTGGFRIDSCINAGQAWINATGTFWWTTTGNEPPMTGLHVVEVVRLNSTAGTADVSDCWANVNWATGMAVSTIEAPVFEGVYLAPAWRLAGSTAHQDTLQFEPFDGGVVNNATLRGCVLFGSKNSALQINALRTATIDSCYILAQGKYPTRYPQPSGTDSGGSWALNGGHGTPAITLENSAVIGGWTVSSDTGNGVTPVFTSVSNVITDADHSSNWPGTYQVYPSINDDNFTSLTGLARPGTPDVDFSLAAIWS